MPESYDKNAHLYGVHPSGTLGQLHQRPGWLWARCRDRKCLNSTPITIAWAVIRWGRDTPVKRLADNLRCERCRRRGANLERPMWYGDGFPAMPIAWVAGIKEARALTERTQFLFSIEEWSPDGNRLIETVAGAKEHRVARAAFEALVDLRPKARVMLRNGAQVMGDSGRPVDMKVNTDKPGDT